MGPPPPFMAHHSMGPPAPPIGPIPRWSQQLAPPPWAYQQNSRPPWAEDQLRQWEPVRSPSRPRPKDALDQLLSESSLKKKGGGSEEKYVELNSI